jgi:hypothetical protein
VDASNNLVLRDEFEARVAGRWCYFDPMAGAAGGLACSEFRLTRGAVTQAQFAH